jgi:multiple antibiotic resistance protein
MFNEEINFFLLACTSLFTMMNPFAVMPLYLSLTKDMDTVKAKMIARKATISAFLVMAFFALTGKVIFKFFSISLDSLKVVGGVLFFVMGYDMLQAKTPRTKDDHEENEDSHEETAISPLGVPLICGPGTITIVILMHQQAKSVTQVSLLYAAMALITFITFLFLIGSKKFLKLIGPSGNKVMFRLMGLIIMVIAVEYFFSGIRPLMRITEGAEQVTPFFSANLFSK